MPSKFHLWFLYTVDGQWSEWKPWTECTRTCGGGVQTRARTCTQPSPAYGGKDCEGRIDETRPCGTDACPGKLMWKKAWHEIIDIWYEILFAICTREYSKKYLRVVYLDGLSYIFLRNDILRCQVVFEKASSHRNYNSDVIRSWNKCGTNKLKIMYPWRFLKKYLQKC